MKVLEKLEDVESNVGNKPARANPHKLPDEGSITILFGKNKLHVVFKYMV